ncbi:MAG: HNH endonuclease, partial [Promethearchaeota archaeon]
MVKYIPDRRYKTGFRTEFEDGDLSNIFLILLVFCTCGLALIPILIIKYFKNRGIKKNQLERSNEYRTQINRIINYIAENPEVHFNDLARFNVDKKWIIKNWANISKYVSQAKLKHNKIVNDGALNENNSSKRSRYISKEIKEIVKARDNYCCVRCGKEEAWNVQLHVDHIIPFSKGGSNNADNLQTLCASCNLIKGNDENFEGNTISPNSKFCDACGKENDFNCSFCETCGYSFNQNEVKVQEEVPKPQILLNEPTNKFEDENKIVDIKKKNRWFLYFFIPIISFIGVFIVYMLLDEWTIFFTIVE